MDVTLSNEWVESYLSALISRGLSSEHIGSSDQQPGIASSSSLEEDPSSITARYYVHQILSLDEDHIRDAWAKSARPTRTGMTQSERDARMEHLSWRVWAMKRRRAQVEAALEADRREAAAQLLREGAEEEEEEDEVDATTLRTIDDLNSTAMAAFEECALAGGGAFGSVAFEALPEELEGLVGKMDDLPMQQPVADAQDGSWTGVKQYTAGTGGTSVATPDLPSLPRIARAKPGATTASTATGTTSAAAAAAARDILGLAAERAGAATGYVSPFAREGVNSHATVSACTSPAHRSQQAAGQTLTAPATPMVATMASGGANPAVAAAPPQPSVVQAATADPLLVSRFPRLYVILISLHGLVRGEKMELGKDPDTGGQVKYVVELAKAMAQFPSVARVDLLTRLIQDPKVDKTYWEPEERLNLPPLPPAAAAVAAYYGSDGTAAAELPDAGSPKSGNSVVLAGNATAEASNSNSAKGAFIVRLQCGPKDVYLRKEDLWPHVREFSDRAIAHAQATLARLQESGEGPCELYVVHGHYADAGEVAAQVASSLGTDCVLTGHSLGRNKKEHLIKSGTMSTAEIEATYRINRRIEAEERALDAASVVFTSTQQEVAEQWGTYDGYSDELSAALQLRPCKGYHVPRMAVIPPGLDFSNLKVSMPTDPWEEVLGNQPLPAGAPLSPSGNSGMVHSPFVSAKINAPVPVPTPPLSPRASNSLLSPPRLSPHNSTTQAIVAPAPAGAGGAGAPSVEAVPAGMSGRIATSTAAPAGTPATPNSVASPGPVTPTSTGSASPLNTSGLGGASSPQPNTPPAVTAIISTNGFSEKGEKGEKPIVEQSPQLSALKINIPRLSAAADPSAAPAHSAPAPTSNGVTGNDTVTEPTTVASSGPLPSEPVPISPHSGNGALAKRVSGLGTATPPTGGSLSARGMQNGTVDHVPPSRRTSHIGTAGNTEGLGTGRHSVAATPRSPTPYGAGGAAAALAAGKMNPRVLAAMMVGESEPGIWKEINRFLRYPGRPVILAMSRPDAKKNILALVRAYGQSRVLRDLANLVLIMGNRDKIDGMAPGSQRVLNDVLKLVDAYDLYGHVAYPKKHTQGDISDIYLLAAATRGVFVNIALQEPFGLTLIEAAAHGAPIVATQNGGPVDIVATLKNGVLVDPTNVRAITDACVQLITSQRTWEEYSENGRRNITYYSWPSHCARYLRTVQDQKLLLGNASRNRMYGQGGQDHKHPGTGGPNRMIRHTLSLSYDDLSTLARAIATSTNATAANIVSDAVANAGKAAETANGSAASDAEAGSSEADAPKSSVTGGSTHGGAASSTAAEQQPAAVSQPVSPALGLRAGSMPPQALGAMMSGLSARPRRPNNRGLKISAAATTLAEGAGEETKAGMEAVTEGDVEQEGADTTPPTPAAGTLSKAPSGVPPLSTHPVYLQPRLTAHQNFVVFNLDTLADVKAAAPVIKALLGMGMQQASTDSSLWAESDLTACVGALTTRFHGNADAAGAGLGVGVMCTWSNKDMRALLLQEGINPLSLDFMVCNAGALIWHAMAPDQPSIPSSPKQLAPAGASDDATAAEPSSETTKPAGQAEQATTTAESGEGGISLSASGRVLSRAGSLGLQLLGIGGGSNSSNKGDAAAEAAAATKDGLAKEGSSWMCDDQWEQHVDFRWDERVVLQVLRRILDNKTGWGKLHIVRPTTATNSSGSSSTPASKPAAAQPPGTTAVALRLSPKCTPYHYMVDVDVGGAVGGRQPLPPAEVANQLLASVRRKLRMCGLRAQVTLTPREPLPTAGDVPSRSKRNMLTQIAGNILSSLQSLARSPSGTGLDASNVSSPNALTLHITPLRCSRPLALRHLATKFRRPMESAWTVVVCAASDSSTSAAGSAAAAPATVLLSTTDGEELVGGVQPVVVLPVKKEQVGLCFPVDISVFGAGVTRGEAEAATEAGKQAPRVQVLEVSST